jgi:hypothetical protein
VLAFSPKDAGTMLEYLIILLITMAGVMRLTLWSAVAGACILVLLPFLEGTQAATAPRNLGATAFGGSTNGSNIAYSIIAALTAYFLGEAIGWLWGI